jgi:hypothetical protein
MPDHRSAAERALALANDTSFLFALDLPESGRRALYAARHMMPSVDWLLYEATDADLLALPGFGRSRLRQFRELAPEIKKIRGDRGVVTFPIPARSSTTTTSPGRSRSMIWQASRRTSSRPAPSRPGCPTTRAS